MAAMAYEFQVAVDCADPHELDNLVLFVEEYNRNGRGVL